MATDGQNFKPGTLEWFEAIKVKRAAKEARKAKASFKQLVSWRKFRINGAAGFAEGAACSCVNRLQAIIAELPLDNPLRYEITNTIVQLKAMQRKIRDYSRAAQNLAEEAEADEQLKHYK